MPMSIITSTAEKFQFSESLVCYAKPRMGFGMHLTNRL